METRRFKSTLADTGREIATAARELNVAMRALSIMAGARAADVAATLDGVFANLRAAAAAIDDLDHQLDWDDEPEDARACPTCGRSVTSVATTCGHCWARLTPSRG